jgi:hypothetical protein
MFSYLYIVFYDAADLLQSTDGEILIRFYVLWYLRLRIDDYVGVKSKYMSCMHRLKMLHSCHS